MSKVETIYRFLVEHDYTAKIWEIPMMYDSEFTSVMEREKLAREAVIEKHFEENGIQKGKTLKVSPVGRATIYEVDATYNLKVVKA